MSMFQRLSNHATASAEKAILDLAVGIATIVVLSIIARSVGVVDAGY